MSNIRPITSMRALDVKKALCRDFDPEMWHLDEHKDKIVYTLQAVSICQRCPIRIKCFDHAYNNASISGVWGGTTTDEREAMRRRKRKQRAAA